jgi:hypothetical protein
MSCINHYGRERRSLNGIFVNTPSCRECKEIDVLRDALDGIRADENDLTISDPYYRWVQLKKV